MGNPHDGDAWQSAGKANRTSSRKINSACRHFFCNKMAFRPLYKEHFFGSIR